MKKVLLLICMCFFYSLLSFAQSSEYSFVFNKHAQDGISTLDGIWEFYWNSFIVSNKKKNFDAKKIMVPGFWMQKTEEITGVRQSFGNASYRTVIHSLTKGKNYAFFIRESPGTACRIYANGEKIFSTGNATEGQDDFLPRNQPIFCTAQPNDRGSIELVVEVSNFVHRKAGLWSSIFFGEEKDVLILYNSMTGIVFFLEGTLLFLFIVNMVLFLLDRKKLSSLYLAVFILVIACRIFTNFFSVLTLLVPSISYGIQLKLEYVAIWAAPICYILFLEKALPGIKHFRVITIGIITCDVVLGFMTSLLPISLSNYLIPLLLVNAVVDLLYILFLLSYSIHKALPYAVYHCFCVGILGLGLVADILYANIKTILPRNFFPFFLLLFVLSQFIFLSIQARNLYKKRLKLTKNLERINKAYLRFVPHEFLDLLKKQDYTEVLLGDYVEREMGIVFSQFSVVSPLKRDISPEEQFEVFSSYTKKIAPVIAKHNGFISKFISRGLIALFPDSSDDAILSCFDLKKEISIINYERKKEGKSTVEIGMGIHYGNMILGTIGEENRLDDTVISDTVNTAARIEGVSEKLSKPIIISLNAAKASSIVKRPPYYLDPLISIRVKGKEKPLSLFECMLLEDL